MPSWVDGTPADTIGLADRGLNLADGHFTTLLLQGGRPRLWPLHRQRLAQGCARLMMAAPDWATLESTLDSAAAGLPERAVAKVVLTRGDQGRGYAANLNQPPRVIVSTHPYPQHYLRWQQAGIRVGLADLVLGSQPALAGLKTLGRTEQVLHRAEVDAGPFDELLATDGGGRILEASAANLFVGYGHTLVTPSLHRGGVAGVLRQHLLHLAPQLGWSVEIRDLHPGELAQADTAFVTNSLMQLVPIIELLGRPLAIPQPLRRLQEAVLR
ncbi:aminodeoxychorismate lyase [Ferrimonas sediminicola]|uniref:Aminodeoxychorismate lyase n=1 Tax=Ferrimonas sediminicola TaxID=2569538 RepID=A0A4U1BGS2_9GAMM|nr:aminodeoxychorismate lyase [Ferrimonas sediminicola]TKB50401.1 aminodeoxychorismate lyase [Ferrimonas sediminicola]